MDRFSMEPFEGSGAEWNRAIGNLPGAHILQTWEWAEVKSAVGWMPMPILWIRSGDEKIRTAGRRSANDVAGAAMVLQRRVTLPTLFRTLSLFYVPKGPLLDWEDVALRARILRDLQVLGRRHGGILLKMDPEVEVGRGLPNREACPHPGSASPIATELGAVGWKFSADQVQFRNTVVLDLTSTEQEILGRMKQKARYNIRVAERKGVKVREGDMGDLPTLFQMYAETSVRDGFVIRGEEYYITVWKKFLRSFESDLQPCAQTLIAEVDGQPIASIFVFYFARRAYYLYGMSTSAHREKMPNHLLQWEAIRRAKSYGCEAYDLWGAPNRFEQQDPMWGVYRFKEGLGGEVVRTLGAWDFPLSRFWYESYTRFLPTVLAVMRSRGRRQTREALGGP